MGLLKHFVLPAFGIMHGIGVIGCKDLTKWAEMVGLPKDSVNEFDDRSHRQNHMLGCLRGFNLSMLVLCGMGIFTESAHFRGKIALAEATVFATAAVDAYRLGTLNYVVPAAQAAVALLGAIVNAMEPGIFTKTKK